MRISVLNLQSALSLGLGAQRDIQPKIEPYRLLLQSHDRSQSYQVTLRPPHPDHMPDPDSCTKLRTLHDQVISGQIHPCFDCAELSELFAMEDPDKREILIVHPTVAHGEILIPELTPTLGMHTLASYSYHSAFCRGGYVFDPRLHHDPIPKGDYQQLVRGVNRGRTPADFKLLSANEQHAASSSLVSGTFANRWKK